MAVGGRLWVLRAGAMVGAISACVSLVGSWCLVLAFVIKFYVGHCWMENLTLPVYTVRPPLPHSCL